MKIGDKIYVKNIYSYIESYTKISGTIQEIYDIIGGDYIAIRLEGQNKRIFPHEYELIPEELQDADIQTIKLYFAL